MSEVPEARGELDEVGVGAVERAEDGEEYVREAVVEGDCERQGLASCFLSLMEPSQFTWWVEVGIQEKFLTLELGPSRQSL